jgi:hypothetical protein
MMETLSILHVLYCKTKIALLVKSVMKFRNPKTILTPYMSLQVKRKHKESNVILSPHRAIDWTYHPVRPRCHLQPQETCLPLGADLRVGVGGGDAAIQLASTPIYSSQCGRCRVRPELISYFSHPAPTTAATKFRCWRPSFASGAAD